MEPINVCVIILTLLLVVPFLVLKFKFDYWKKKGVYTETPSLLFGTAKYLITQKSQLAFEFRNVYNHFKGKSLAFGGYYFLAKPILVAVDLDLIKKILITDFEYFTDRSLHVQDYEPLSQQLFALKGSKWKGARSQLSPAFTMSKNRVLFDTVLKTVEELLQILDEASGRHATVDVNDLSSRYSIDVISSCVFGFDCNSLKDPDSEVRRIILSLFEPTFRNTILLLLGWVAPNILGFFKIKYYRKTITNFFINLMEETVKYRESKKVSRPDFVDLLIQIRNNGENPENLTILQMASHSLNFFAAGYESTSSAITCCLYELALNKEIQEKARREVQKSFQQHATVSKISYDVVQSLSYVEQVIQETMRKYPSLPVLFRECTKDYVIPNTHVKIDKGCLVFIPLFGIKRDPDIYPNPEQFDPERFSSDEIKNRHSCSWMPFGLGPRKCIAYQFGLMEVKTIIASLLLKYHWTLDSKTEQPLKLSEKSILIMADGEVLINFRKL